jgi:UDP:flavonoid glycosyltransferase YjiC (YdhE family)
MVSAISGVGAAQIATVTRAQEEIIAALADQQAAEQKLALAAIGGNQAGKKAATGALVDVMA